MLARNSFRQTACMAGAALSGQLQRDSLAACIGASHVPPPPAGLCVGPRRGRSRRARALGRPSAGGPRRVVWIPGHLGVDGDGAERGGGDATRGGYSRGDAIGYSSEWAGRALRFHLGVKIAIDSRGGGVAVIAAGGLALILAGGRADSGGRELGVGKRKGGAAAGQLGVLLESPLLAGEERDERAEASSATKKKKGNQRTASERARRGDRMEYQSLGSICASKLTEAAGQQKRRTGAWGDQEKGGTAAGWLPRAPGLGESAADGGIAGGRGQ